MALRIFLFSLAFYARTVPDVMSRGPLRPYNQPTTSGSDPQRNMGLSISDPTMSQSPSSPRRAPTGVMPDDKMVLPPEEDVSLGFEGGVERRQPSSTSDPALNDRERALRGGVLAPTEPSGASAEREERRELRLRDAR